MYKSELSTRNDKASRCGLLSLTLWWCPISCAGELPDTKVQQVYQRWMRMCALLHCGNVDCPALTKGLLNCRAQLPTLSTLHSPRRERVHKTTGLSDVQFTYKPRNVFSIDHHWGYLQALVMSHIVMGSGRNVHQLQCFSEVPLRSMKLRAQIPVTAAALWSGWNAITVVCQEPRVVEINAKPSTGRYP